MLLSRTAAALYWIGRNLERADFVARLIEATMRFETLSRRGVASAWSSAVTAGANAAAFAQRGGTPTRASVSHFLACDPANPSSIRACLDSARHNARHIRTALTAEVWESLNGGWLDVNAAVRAPGGPDVEAVVRHAKGSVREIEGALHRTMLRNDAFWFLRLGGAIERGDNTARLLDVKYNLLLPKGESVGGSLDQAQWSTILQAVSARTAYRWIYRQGLEPWLIADLLMFKPEMPRSLVACMFEASDLLSRLGQQSGRVGPADRQARLLLRRLEGGDIDTVFSNGLHEYVSAFITENNALSEAVREQFLF
jgi:uncharacterized alpha-E superfamily protein